MAYTKGLLYRIRNVHIETIMYEKTQNSQKILKTFLIPIPKF
jgi:hypothetical protein